jgi:hypothetical protein
MAAAGISPLSKIECIQEIGNAIVRVDRLRGSLSPGTPRRKKIDEFRGQLNDKQLELADLLFQEHTSSYKNATVELKTEIDRLNGVIDDIEKVVKTLDALAKVVASIDKLFLLATGVG